MHISTKEGMIGHYFLFRSAHVLRSFMFIGFGTQFNHTSIRHVGPTAKLEAFLESLGEFFGNFCKRCIFHSFYKTRSDTDISWVSDFGVGFYQEHHHLFTTTMAEPPMVHAGNGWILVLQCSCTFQMTIKLDIRVS